MTEKKSNKKFYLVLSLVILVIIAIASSIIFMSNKSNSAPTAQGNTLEVKDDKTSTTDGSGTPSDSSTGGSGGGKPVETPYPYRIFFPRSFPTKGSEIISVAANGTDEMTHFNGAEAADELISDVKLVPSSKGSKLLFSDFKTAKILDLHSDKVVVDLIKDLKVEVGKDYHFSSDDKKVVYVTKAAPQELVILNLETKTVEYKKVFEKEVSISGPHFVSKDSEILLITAKTEARVTNSKLVKVEIKTGDIKDVASFDGVNFNQSELSPDGTKLVVITGGIPARLKVYNFDTSSLEDYYENHNYMSILRWSEDGKKVYLSVDNVKLGDNLHEYEFDKKLMSPLKNEKGEMIKVNFIK